MTTGQDWIDPHTAKYQTDPQKLREICSAWMYGRSRKDIVLDTGVPVSRVNRILTANFQIEWIDGAWCRGVWRGDYLEHDSFSIVELAANNSIFEYLGMSKRLTREPLMGSQVATRPTQFMRCNICKTEWFVGHGEQSGCFHVTARSNAIALSILGNGYSDPDPSTIPLPLTLQEFEFFKHAIFGLLNARLRDIHAVIKIITTSCRNTGARFDFDEEAGDFLKDVAAQSGQAPIDVFEDIVTSALHLTKTGSTT